ncbi:MAG: hypothetical protein FJ117_17870 [Deltaproteobacteria bacterium]|nr:hypothetical protein [Deltaproteobacteria bacterium]
MNNLSSLQSAANPNQALLQTKRKSTLNQEDFINLFVTQLKFQNPLEPLDNFQMATQMAQMNSVQSLNNINESLNNMAANQASVSSLQAAGLIGKKVEVSGDRLIVDGGKISEGVYQLSKPGKVAIQIYDANGKLIRVIEEGTKDAAKHKLAWDGKNQNGAQMPDGTYGFKVLGLNENGQLISVNSSVIGTVTGISFENGATYLNIGAEKIKFSDISAIFS